MHLNVALTIHICLHDYKLFPQCCVGTLIFIQNFMYLAPDTYQLF